MITLECASLKGHLECASLSVSAGKICAVVAETGFEKDFLLKVFTGMERLDSGKIFVFGKELSSIPFSELNEIRKRMGIVLNNGGMISNLKVWENLMLPLMYHTSLTHSNIEEKMMNILHKAGYEDDLNMLPGPLPEYKKRLAGLARAMLTEPDIMIYDSVLDGLSPDMKNKAIGTISAFHREKEGRASLFLDSDESAINDIKADNIFLLKKGKFHERN